MILQVFYRQQNLVSKCFVVKSYICVTVKSILPEIVELVGEQVLLTENSVLLVEQSVQLEREGFID